MMKKIVHWSPRILVILAILFVSMFALDSFNPKLTLQEQILGFLIHMLPSFILAVILIVAWKYELIGGVIFVVLGLGFSPWLFFHNYGMNHNIMISLSIIGLITFPFIISGSLFIYDHYLKARRH